MKETGSGKVALRFEGLKFLRAYTDSLGQDLTLYAVKDEPGLFYKVSEQHARKKGQKFIHAMCDDKLSCFVRAAKVEEELLQAGFVILPAVEYGPLFGAQGKPLTEVLDDPEADLKPGEQHPAAGTDAVFSAGEAQYLGDHPEPEDDLSEPPVADPLAEVPGNGQLFRPEYGATAGDRKPRRKRS